MCFLNFVANFFLQNCQKLRNIEFISFLAFLVFMGLLHRAALSNLLLCFLSQNLGIMSSSRTTQDIKIIMCWLLRYLRTNSEIHARRWIQDGFRAGDYNKFKINNCFETEISGICTSMHYMDQNFARLYRNHVKLQSFWQAL